MFLEVLPGPYGVVWKGGCRTPQGNMMVTLSLLGQDCIGVWAHVALVYTGARFCLYYNGQLAAQVPCVHPVPPCRISRRRRAVRSLGTPRVLHFGFAFGAALAPAGAGQGGGGGGMKGRIQGTHPPSPLESPSVTLQPLLRAPCVPTVWARVSGLVPLCGPLVWPPVCPKESVYHWFACVIREYV